jgi:hypothetical protein
MSGNLGKVQKCDFSRTNLDKKLKHFFVLKDWSKYCFTDKLYKY